MRQNIITIAISIVVASIIFNAPSLLATSDYQASLEQRVAQLEARVAKLEAAIVGSAATIQRSVAPAPVAPAAPRATTNTQASTRTTANNNTNLYNGPGTHYQAIASVQPGGVLNVTGRSPDGVWYQLDHRYWIQVYFVSNAPSAPVVHTVQAAPAQSAVAQTAPAPF